MRAILQSSFYLVDLLVAFQNTVFSQRGLPKAILSYFLMMFPVNAVVPDTICDKCSLLKFPPNH